MSLTIIFLLMASHWFCDFVLQTDAQAKNKSSNITALVNHTAIYSYGMFAILLCYNGFVIGVGDIEMIRDCISFFFITFAAHTITDCFTSRLNKYLWLKGDSHNFFVSVGFDQLLHYAQLFLTYKLLFTNG